MDNYLDEWIPKPVGDFPTCESCIFAFEDGRECHFGIPIATIDPETQHPYEHDSWPPTVPETYCGKGVFVIGEPPNQRLIDLATWHREMIEVRNEQARQAIGTMQAPEIGEQEDDGEVD